jgi:hypothetical protein
MRATFGKRSGPITTNATTAMRASLETPRSIMSNELKNNDGVYQAQVRVPTMTNTPDAWRS